VHDGIRSYGDPATVAPRVVANDEIKSALLGEIQCNATQGSATLYEFVIGIIIVVVIVRRW